MVCLAVAQSDAPQFFGENRRIEAPKKRLEWRCLENRTVPKDILTHDRAHESRSFRALMRRDGWDGEMHGIRLKKRTGVRGDCAAIIPGISFSRHQGRRAFSCRKFTVNGSSRFN